MTYGRPGVYISERNLPSPITSGATANAAGACLGVFEKGPADITLVTSWYDFAKRFGGYNAAYPASFEVSQFFRNGGGELYVRRVLHEVPSGVEDTAIAGYATVDITNGDDDVILTVDAVNPGEDGTKFRVQLTGAGTVNDVDYYNLGVYYEQGTNETSTADDIVLETWRNVALDGETLSDYIESVINGVSEYITVTRSATSVGTIDTSVFPLAGVDLDGAAPDSTDATLALADFDTMTRPLVFFIPAVWSSFDDGGAVQDSLATWCAANNSFAILDTEAGLDPAGALDVADATAATAYAAVYYPNVYIPDPLGRSRNSLRKIGPASSVAGLALTTDRTVGVFKTPAGLRTPLTGVAAPERVFTSAELDTLNSSTPPVNAIRSVPGAGVVVMGGRTLFAGGGANRYVAMRRSLNYIRKQAEMLTEFALFEVNNQNLWSRLNTTLDVFLNEYRNQGGLRGNIASDAYFIKCDRENNTEASIAAGEVNIEIGVALEYPAEFVVITLTQKTIN